MSCTSILAIVFLFCIASSNAAVDIQPICQKAKNPSFCINLLAPKAGGDLKSLAQYTLNVDRTDTSNTVSLLKTLIGKSGVDPKLHSHYKNCLDHFDEEQALGDILEAIQLLKALDYQGVSSYMSAVMTNVDECLTDESPPDTSDLPKSAETVYQVSQISLIISNMLSNK
ncbi:pectinesterase inhibitor 1-like [Vicia villosa]|uniref:pectinesterase inhibitor 1-like n=1 Tax=Vicia villosa TaxID=3911 RepID=UPI00273BF52F|nr:pectinesterase inhibitor 1-like [Vicia villosa]